MVLLILFGFVAGAATAVSPCVLPVLPIALSAGATGGRSRPLGIVVGLALSFTFATVALVYVISALGLPDDFLRDLAIVVLIVFGVTLIVPALSARVEASLSRLTSRIRTPKGGDGFWSGTAIGASLGLVYAPCAGPILAGVITVSASQSFSTGRLAVALSYGIGSAVVLYFLMLGGRKVVRPLAQRGVGLQVAMGAVMVIVALAMLGNYDIRFQNHIASSLPSFLVDPSKGIEETASAKAALADVRGDGGHGVGSEASGAAPETGADGTLKKLPVLAVAPEFVGTEQWFNTPGDKPLTLRGLRGRVVLVDFWTYSCINCIRTLPYLKAWDAKYRKDGLTIVGVHTPEFPFEREASNVETAIEENGIRYPVVQDNEQATWNAYGNQYWPAEYFIDAQGRVRYVHFGEGEYGEKEKVIRELLAEAGRPVKGGDARVHAIAPSPTVTTPETYLGAARAERFTNAMLSPGSHDFTAPKALPANEFAYHGKWRITLESATAGTAASLDLNFGARRVYLVLGSPGRDRKVRVLLDGQPISAADAGTDVHDGAVTVTGQRLYNLVNLPKVGHHVLTLEPEAGVQGYAFTFG
ncbi:MAG TPA: cytochrome c biogenesis protein DipZ [Solirubrobacterales bacterium]|nr:cytochrome c biogenesis protein DipZ [Solirubrobacterales bacterium]